MAKIYYTRVDEFWRKEQKYDFLEQQAHSGQVAWQTLAPDQKHNWLTEGMSDEYETFLSLGTREAKGLKGTESKTIFKIFSLGANTNRDTWAYNFNHFALTENMKRFIATYNAEVDRWHSRTDRKIELDNFVLNDETRIKWSSRLKECLLRRQKAEFSDHKLRNS
jgi:predicted helicase